MQLWVRDTGPGVPPADRLRIFDRFESAARVPGGTGTGLGLAIVSAIARAHGGSARVVAGGPAGGALFVLDLPATSPGAEGDGSWPAAEDYESVSGLFDRVNAGSGRS